MILAFERAFQADLLSETAVTIGIMIDLWIGLAILVAYRAHASGACG